jgi:protein phosphatase
MSVFDFLNCASIALKVQISLQNQRVPAGVGMASDPMVARRSGKKLPMEDISLCQYPLQGLGQVGN